MKKFYLLTKTLLVAVCLLVGASNAWAGEKSTIYSKALSGWSSDDITASSSTFTASKWTPSQTGDANKGLWTSTTTGLMTRCRQNTVTGTLTLDRAANTIVTLDAVWNVGDNDNNGTGHTNGYNQYNYFQYGDLLIATCLDNRSTDYSYTINGIKTTFSNVTAGCLLNTDLTIHLVVNSTSKEISEFYIKNGETILAQFSDLTDDNNTFAASSDYDKVITKAYTNVSRTNAFNYLKSITVQQETQSVPTANVTFKYEDTAGNSLSEYKSDQVLEDVALGTTISTLIASPYTDIFYNGTSNKYIYSSYVVTGDYTTVQEGGNTVTLKFTDYPATAYTVKAQVGGADLTTLASGTAYLDGSTTEYWNKYINVDDQWYVADEATYGAAITTATKNVSFTAIDGFDYYWEAEDMTCSRSYGTINNNTSYSNGSGTGVYSGANLQSTVKVAAGVYTISGGAIVRKSTAQPYNISYSTDGETWTATGSALTFAVDATTASVNVNIPSEAYIRLIEGNDANAYNYMDYITLKKLPENVSATIGSYQYASFSSTYPVNVDVEGLEAYIATSSNGTSVTMEKVTGNVAAGTGLVITGAAGSYTLPVVASGEWYNTTTDPKNYLFAVNSDYNLAAAGEGGTNYVLSVQSEKVVWAPIGATAAPVKSGQAALWLPASNSARALRMSFGGITGVENVEAAAEAIAKKNGAYLENGKIAIYKNGMKFNAAGAQMK